jgi:hypothetical protein
LLSKSLLVRSKGDVAELLGETINQVRRGELDLRVSNAIGYLSGILLSAMEKGSLEERLATLEAVFASRDNSNKTFPSTRALTLCNRIK